MPRKDPELKTGDIVTALSLIEDGTPHQLKGEVQIFSFPADLYPAFDAFFVDGTEADPTTITPSTTTAAASEQYVEYLRNRNEQFANPCHDKNSGEFCETPDNERYFGDYKMEYVSPNMGSGLHKIVTSLGDTPVAEMSWDAKQIHGLDVTNDHQRKGIASAMWDWGQDMRPRPKHSSDRTVQGDLWAKAIGGKLPRRKPEPPPFQYGTETEQFTNPCHNPHDGRFCETPDGSLSESYISAAWDKAVQEASPTPRGYGSYWLLRNGDYAYAEKGHASVFEAKDQVSDEAYKEFTEKTGAVRVHVGDNSLEVSVFRPMTQDQIEALSFLKKHVVFVESLRRDGSMYNEEIRAGGDVKNALNRANNVVKGQEATHRPKSVEFLATQEIKTFANPCHDPETGEFCETPGAPGHEGHTGEDEYRGQHQPPGPEDSANLTELDKVMPEDVYTHPEYYDHSGGSQAYDREAARIIKSLKGADPDTPITIYRAAPPGVTSINKGDWVTISKTYAKQHGYNDEGEGEEDWPVYEITVPVKDVYFGGNDIVEQGYWGENTPTKVVRASASKYIQLLSARALHLADVEFHADHDQSSHGNWASGAGAGKGFLAADVERISPDSQSSEVVTVGKHLETELTEDEWQSLRNYTTNDYRYVNKYLQDPEAYNPEVEYAQEQIRNIDSALAKAPTLTTPVIVYRGVEYPHLSQEQVATLIDSQYKEGQEISLSHGGYQSTSFNVEAPLDHSLTEHNNGLIFEIKARKGLPLVESGAGSYDDESEFLIDKDAKFRVISIQQNVTFLKGADFDEVNRPYVIQVEQIL